MEKGEVLMFRVAVTCIICKISQDLERRYLILKRSSEEKHGREMWTVAGGIIEECDWKDIKSKYNFPLWYDVTKRALVRELKEETGLEIFNLKYLCDCIFIHKSGSPEIVLSFWTRHFRGKIKLSKEHTDYAWVTVDELNKYNLLIDIPMEIRDVDKLIYDEINDIIFGR